MISVHRYFLLPILGILFLVVCAIVGCGDVIGIDSDMSDDEASNISQNSSIILATTTSTQDSGLLDYLLPVFERQSGYSVKTIAVGTGQALKMGENGDADILFVHAPEAEQPFMDAGHGADRRLVMHNDFVIVGPMQDPAGIKGKKAAVEVFQTIADTHSSFVSRGDDSGTHKKELSLWGDAHENLEGSWYIESGRGMGATLMIASEKTAYTLSDRSSFLANRVNLDLEILVEGDAVLLNVYHVMLVNPEKWSWVNAEGGRALADFLTSHEGQAMIGEYGIGEFGQSLFIADAGKTEAELKMP